MGWRKQVKMEEDKVTKAAEERDELTREVGALAQKLLIMKTREEALQREIENKQGSYWD